MALSRESLEGGVRLAQVRRIKKFLILAQVILVLGVVIVLTLLDGHIQLEPFYFNISSVVYFVVLMLLITGLENFIFLLLELRFVKSPSDKYYMLKTSGRRSVMVIIAALVVVIVLLTPISTVLANLDSAKGETSSSIGFMNRDPLGLTVVDDISVVSDEPTEVIILTEENYHLYGGNMTLMRQHSTVYFTSLPVKQSVDFPQIPFEKFFLVVDVDNPRYVHYEVHKSLSPEFRAIVTLFAALFVGFYSIWVFTTFRLNKENKKAAIYR